MSQSRPIPKIDHLRAGLAQRRAAAKRPLIADKAAMANGMDLVKLGLAEVRRSAPKAFGDADRFEAFTDNVRAIVEAEAGGPVDPRLVRAPAGANEADPQRRGIPVAD